MGASPPNFLSLISEESMLNDPIELFGIIVILIALFLIVIFSRILYKSYKENHDIATLYLIIAFILLVIAAFFLFIEQFAYSMGNISLGDIGGIIATISVGSSMVFVALFAFHNTFPDKVKILGTLVAIGSIIYVGTISWAILQSPPIKDVINNEIIYTTWINILIYCTVIPIILVAPMTFHYFGYKIRAENKPSSNRSYWFAVAFYIFGAGYIGELAPFFPTFLSNILRVTYLIAAIILYNCFTMPEWFKKRLGMTS
ncbi:MAG: hypothetical protein ACTSRG_09345 [Candidatus Helarchaeota archaeon]